MISDDRSTSILLRYWRFTTAICAAHAAGFELPPNPAVPVLRSATGHWGANPGIAWIAAHVAHLWDKSFPILGVLGTGHGVSFEFAHRLAKEPMPDWQYVNKTIASVGQLGGLPTEDLSSPTNAVHTFGELGPAVGVSQSLARYSDRFVLCIIGDGECETPVALSALAHWRTILPNGAGQCLIAINCNGHRMGGQAALSTAQLERLLGSLGYLVFISGTNPNEAVSQAAAAMQSALSGKPTVWLSVSQKGWPAPETLADLPFSGFYAHKLRGIHKNAEAVEEFRRFFLDFSDGIFDLDATKISQLNEFASRLVFSVPRPKLQPLALETKVLAERTVYASAAAAIDKVLSCHGVKVFSPDEAESNGFVLCAADGLLTEVLAEELLFAWTIGCLAAGQRAAFVTYECFAPLVASQITQYCKLVRAQPNMVRPPLLFISTSLGWANSPTHQNTDIVDIFLNRGDNTCQFICPVSAESARLRLEQRMTVSKPGIVAISMSKHLLPNIPDPGGPIVCYMPPTTSDPDVTIISCGDICLVEALAAAQLAFERGINIEVIAIVELTALRENQLAPHIPDTRPILASVWCQARSLEGLLFRAAGRVFEVRGASEIPSATPYECLQVAGVDRFSLASTLGTELQDDRYSYDWSDSLLIPNFKINPGWRNYPLDC